MLFTSKKIMPLATSNYVISCMLHCDYESNIICTIMTIYTIVLCTDGMNLLMCYCVLLASPGILPYWMIVYIIVLSIFYMSMQVLTHYGSMYVSMYEKSIPLHPLSHSITKMILFQ